MVADDGTPISRATRNSWEHETLYLTSYGVFVMHFFSKHNPTLVQFVEWDLERAVKWLLSNGYFEDVKKLELAREAEKHRI